MNAPGPVAGRVQFPLQGVREPCEKDFQIETHMGPALSAPHSGIHLMDVARRLLDRDMRRAFAFERNTP